MPKKQKRQDDESTVEGLYAKIGRLEIENDFLKKVLFKQYLVLYQSRTRHLHTQKTSRKSQASDQYRGLPFHPPRYSPNSPKRLPMAPQTTYIH